MLLRVFLVWLFQLKSQAHDIFRQPFQSKKKKHRNLITFGLVEVKKEFKREVNTTDSVKSINFRADTFVISLASSVWLISCQSERGWRMFFFLCFNYKWNVCFSGIFFFFLLPIIGMRIKVSDSLLNQSQWEKKLFEMFYHSDFASIYCVHQHSFQRILFFCTLKLNRITNEIHRNRIMCLISFLLFFSLDFNVYFSHSFTPLFSLFWCFDWSFDWQFTPFQKPSISNWKYFESDKFGKLKKK